MRVCCIALLSLLFCAVADGETRGFDGRGNNIVNTNWGAAGTELVRWAPANYQDNIEAPQHAGRPGPREISNALFDQPESVKNEWLLSDYVVQWGQFIDHDITLTTHSDPPEDDDIAVPSGDPWFDPATTGVEVISFTRTQEATGSGTSTNNPREHLNLITAYIDASMVYGSDTNRARELRTLVDGKLKTSAWDLLPFNTNGFANANAGPLPGDELFLAGDVRANEQVGLTGLHTLFVREHNRLCDEIRLQEPGWPDEQIYQQARKLVGALIQVITYREFLPALLGPHAPPATASYDATVNASIANEFATALYRVGHTMVSSAIMRFEDSNLPTDEGHFELKNCYFNSYLLTNHASLECVLKGLASRRHERIDNLVVDDLRNFLFGPPGAGGFDLPSLNMQRGRDHGLPDYNTMRSTLGLAEADFTDISSDPFVQQALSNLYGAASNIDLWVGALSEDHLPGAAVGELLAVGLSNQFSRLQRGDRFWYGNDTSLVGSVVAELEATRLCDVIKRNTGITTIQSNVFYVIPEPNVDLASGSVPGDMQVLWMGASNASYQVQCNDNLVAGGWTNISPMMNGHDAMIDMTHSNAGNRLFYRVRQFP